VFPSFCLSFSLSSLSHFSQVSALNAIMGEDWAIVPFIHSSFGGSGSGDQTW